MIEVRFHARMGQGTVEAAKILAASFRLAGRDASWFIPIGWEDAVNFDAALARADEGSQDKRISALAVFYPPLLEIPDVWVKFEHPDLVLVNSRDPVSTLDLCGGERTAIVDASGIARSIGPCYGIPSLAPPMLGALAAAGNIILGIHLIEALKHTARVLRLTRKDFDRLVRALEAGYDHVKIRGGRVKERVESQNCSESVQVLY